MKDTIGNVEKMETAELLEVVRQKVVFVLFPIAVVLKLLCGITMWKEKRERMRAQ